MPALLKTTQIQEPSSASVNLTLDTSGNGTFAGTSVMSSPYTMRNKIINGAMVIDQRNAGASKTITTANEYTLDRWYGVSSVTSKFSIQQNAGSVTPPAGFTNYLGATSLSAYTVGAAENYLIAQIIEGYNVADLAWGTASAKTITLSFWVRSSLTGTFGGTLTNSAYNRSYPFSFTISSANTWEQKSITISGDTSGTWLTNNGIGLILFFSLGAGSSQSGPAGAWAGSFYASATGATSVVGTNGATFYITGVQLEIGTAATPFEYRNYQQELAMCQRYYQLSNNFVGVGTSPTTVNGMISYPVTMRTSPSVGLTGVFNVSDYYVADYTQSSAAISLFNATPTGSAVTLSNFSGVTTGRLTFARCANSNTITLSAEL